MVFYFLFQLTSRGNRTMAVLVLGALGDPNAKLMEERGDERWSPQRGEGRMGEHQGAQQVLHRRAPPRPAPGQGSAALGPGLRWRLIPASGFAADLPLVGP